MRVHAGEGGASTAAAHGARAVAIGSDIFMGKGQFDPSSADGRELLAHEVAHTVQAKTHAGPVAAAAKRNGDSAETAEVDADAFASSFRKSGSAARWTPAVGVADRTPMRAPSVAPQPGSGNPAPTTPMYVNTHRVRIVSAIRDRINAVGLAEPHPRLRWATQEQAKAAIAAAISEYVDAASDFSLKQLMKLSYPADLLAIIDTARAEGGTGWNPSVGLAVGLAMSEPLDASIQRMGMRLRVQLDAHATMPRASELVASSPLDGIVAGVLTKPGLVLPSAKKQGAVDDTPGKPFAGGVHEVTYEWQGAHDPNLWNWIKVTSPQHATAEDVAHTPLAGGEVKDGSEQAYRIVAKPPYFGIPFETARLVPDAVKHAPLKVRAQLASGPGPRVPDATALETSEASDDAALAQAPTPTKTDLPAKRSLDRAKAQLDFLWQRLSPWNASAPLMAATTFLERRRAELERDPASATHWQTALAAQERALYLASSEAAEVVTQIEARAKPSDADHLQPAVRLLLAYAHAAGVSHLASDAMPALEEARRQRALLPVTLAEDKIQGAHEGAAALRGAQGDSGATVEAGAESAVGEVPDLDRRAADLRLRFSRGEMPDPDTVDQLAVDGDELAVRERILTIKTQVAAVVHRVDEVGLPKPTFSGGIPTPRALAQVLLERKVPEWLGVLERAKHWRGPVQGKTAAQAITHQMRQAVDEVAQDIIGFNEIGEVGQWLQWANKAVVDQELSNRIKSLAIQLGIMIVTGEIAGAAVTAMRGVALGTELISDVRGAGLAYKAAEIGIHAGLATLGQGAAGGDLSGGVFAENAIGILATSAAMKPFEGLLADSEAVEQEVQRSWAQTAKHGAKVGVEMVLETGAGITGSTIAHAATHGMDATAPGSGDLIEQGIALAASRFVGQRMRGMHERIEVAARELGPAAFEKLLTKVDALAGRANNAKQPSIPEARALLVERRQYLDEERELYKTQTASKDPVKARAAASAAGHLDADLAASPLTATVRLTGLTPVVDGQVYEGSPREVQDALAAAKASGPEVHDSYDPASGVHQVTAGGESIKIHEIRSSAHEQANSALRDRRGEERPKVLEAYTGPDLKSARHLAEQHPDSQVVAAEGRYVPSPSEIAKFRAEGGEFLAERFAESLPAGSVEKIYVRYPMPHEKGIENANHEQVAAFQRIMAENPGMNVRDAMQRAQQEVESQVDSVKNFGPHALEKLKPGATMEVIFWEKAVVNELAELTSHKYMDPATGEVFRLEVVSGPTMVSRSIAPHSGGFGIPANVEQVTQMVLRKVTAQ